MGLRDAMKVLKNVSQRLTFYSNNSKLLFEVYQGIVLNSIPTSPKNEKIHLHRFVSYNDAILVDCEYLEWETGMRFDKHPLTE